MATAESSATNISGYFNSDLNRRAVLQRLAFLGGASLLALSTGSDRRSGAASSGLQRKRQLGVLMTTSAVPAFDSSFDRFVANWQVENKVEVDLSRSAPNEMATTVAVLAVRKEGADIVALTRGGQAHFFGNYLADLSDLASDLGKNFGGFLKTGQDLSITEGSWKSIPLYYAGWFGLYRRDWFEDIGIMPDTWDNLLAAGKKLKPRNRPIGIPAGILSNDSNISWSSLLWSYGARVLADDGKTPAINSPETRLALEMSNNLIKKALADDATDWNDLTNNTRFILEQASWIHNSLSPLIAAKKTPQLDLNIAVALPPQGPKGRFTSATAIQLAVGGWSRNQELAKQFIRDYVASLDQHLPLAAGNVLPFLNGFSASLDQIIALDPRLSVIRQASEITQFPGYPGTSSYNSWTIDGNFVVPKMVRDAYLYNDIDKAIENGEKDIVRFLAQSRDRF